MWLKGVMTYLNLPFPGSSIAGVKIFCAFKTSASFNTAAAKNIVVIFAERNRNNL